MKPLNEVQKLQKTAGLIKEDNDLDKDLNKDEIKDEDPESTVTLTLTQKEKRILINLLRDYDVYHPRNNSIIKKLRSLN